MTMKYGFCTIVALAGVALAGICVQADAQQPGTALPTGTPSMISQSVPATAGASADYRVGPGDLLAITVYRSPDLQSTLRVGTDGTIEFPALGKVKVEGDTAGDIASRLARSLRTAGILVSPSVNVLVAEVRSKVVTVMGAVGRPGEFPLDRPDLSLASVLARAGATFGSGSGVVTVMPAGAVREGREEFLIADLVSGAKDRPARPGEILVVRSAPMFYVSGEVGRPGAFALEPGMTVGQALAVGGGITPRGSAGRVRLTRRGPDGTQQVFDKVKPDMAVMPDDLIYARQRIF
ncbi:hypothetical protein ASG07_15550 [Sphingomonas sp. Leaf343]|nr:hypothetical protein ASG07_15550 [Sphingomonas sp. Leaf343]